jgi:hypothetical protein
VAVTVEQIERAIKQAKGNISAVATALDVTRSAVYSRIEKNAKLKELVDDLREARIDIAEDKLGEAVEKGEGWAVCFALKTVGQKRGYVEKQKLEHTGEDGKPIEAKFIVEVITRDSNSSTTDQDKD